MMDDFSPQVWFRSRAPWLRGGIRGVLVCFVLFILYSVAYYLIPPEYVSSWIQVAVEYLAMLSGHLFLLFFSYFFSGAGNGVFIGTIILLHAIYFAIGAGIAVFIEKRQKRQARNLV